MPRTAGSRLSTARCRQLLGRIGTGLTDASVEQLRDQLYAIAECVVRLEYNSPRMRLEHRLGSLPESERVSVSERAAILEFDGELSEAQALERALEWHVDSETHNQDGRRTH